jgi:hypothetical protein
MRRVLPLILVVAGAIGCASVRTRPSALADAAAAARTEQAREASELAPASFAEAERLRRAADAAFEAEDASGAQILGEQAIVAYARAFVHARTARGQRAAEEARAELATQKDELAKVREEQGRVGAEVTSLETKIKVVRDALPVARTDAGDPAREAARLESARAIATEARLLCVSARLLAPEVEGLKQADSTLEELAKALAAPPRPAPIDLATRSRSECLSALTHARRTVQKAGDDAADVLLSELSREGSFAPVRDDRGIVISVSEAFAGAELTKDATSKLELVGKIAAAHADMPLLIVVHSADGAKEGSKRDRDRGDAARRVITKSRAERVDVAQAGSTRPLVDPRDKAARGRNERLEIVFVSAR